MVNMSWFATTIGVKVAVIMAAAEHPVLMDASEPDECTDELRAVSGAKNESGRSCGPRAGAGEQERERAVRPEDLGRFFVDRANAGDLEGLVALYEPDAVLSVPGGA